MLKSKASVSSMAFQTAIIFSRVNGRISFLEKDDHHAVVYTMWIKPAFVSDIFEVR